LEKEAMRKRGPGRKEEVIMTWDKVLSSNDSPPETTEEPTK